MHHGLSLISTALSSALQPHRQRVIIMGEVVCVTGAGGFIAGHVVKQLLDAGHTVKGTCRDPLSTDMDYLRDLPGASDRLELFPADLLADGSFDKAVRGCTYVFHVASPVVILEAVDAGECQTDSILSSAHPRHIAWNRLLFFAHPRFFPVYTFCH